MTQQTGRREQIYPLSACMDHKCRCGFIWSADGNIHVASIHGPDDLEQPWYGSDICASRELQERTSRELVLAANAVAEKSLWRSLIKFFRARSFVMEKQP